MGPEYAAALAIASAVSAAAAGTAGAAISAKNASDAKDDARNAAKVQAKQLNDQKMAEQARNRMEAEKVKGRLRVLAAASGFSVDGGSYGDLIEQANYETGLNSGVINQNYRNNINRLNSGLSAQLGEYSARSSAAMASRPGLYIGSLNTGLSINNSLREPPQPYFPVGGR